MKISVIIVARAAEFCRALESVSAQTYGDYEVIVVATDAAAMHGAAEEFGSRARVKTVFPAGASRGAALNAGIDAASGDCLAFIDENDCAAPEFLEKTAAAMRGSGAEIVVCGADYAVGGELCPPSGVFDAARATEACLHGEISPELAAKLLRRSAFGELRFMEIGDFPELALTYQLLLRAEKIAVVGEKLYASARSATPFICDPKMLTQQHIFQHLAILRERVENVAVALPQLERYAVYTEWSYMIETVELISRLGIGTCGSALRYMRNELKTYWNAVMTSDLTRDYQKAWMRQYV